MRALNAKLTDQPSENPAELAGSLAEGAELLGIALDEHQRERMLAYLALMRYWNRAYNLTAVTQPREMVARHLLDSLSILPWVRGPEVLDAGTGGGLPGVVLAIACPAMRFRLVDGNGKKVRFLRQVRRELGLDNIEPVHARLEALPVDPVPDTIVARALAPLGRMAGWIDRWLDKGARLLAMKSALDESELGEVGGAYNVEVIHLEVPGLDARRSLAIVSKK